MKFSKLVLVLAAVSFSTAALANAHIYKIPKIAATEQACLETERWVVPRFAALAEAQVLSHGCELNPSRTFDLVIQYAKPTVANLVSTYEEFDYVHGLYTSAEECVAHYDEDMTIFRNATGLEPLIAYCFRDRGGEDLETAWTMRIDGFGTPKLAPQHLARDFYNGINGDIAQYESQMLTALQSFGARDVKVKILSSSDRSTIHAFYYAEKRLPMTQYSEGQFKTLAACEGYRSLMSEIFTRADGYTLIYMCGQNNYSEKVYLYTAGVVMQPLATELTAINYPTVEACEAKRRETESSWRDGLQKNVIGSICAIEDNLIHEHVRMRMFWLD